jgi:hypothetical protein
MGDFRMFYGPKNRSVLAGCKKVPVFGAVAPRTDKKNTKFPEKSALLPFFDQKKTVSWGIVHGNRKIGPPLGRSFEKWFAV